MRERLPAPVWRFRVGQLRWERIADRTGVLHDVAGEASAVGRELDFALAAAEAEHAEGKLVGHVAGVVGQRHGPGEAVVVEEGLPAARGRIDKDELVARPGVVAVPEALGVAGLHPVGGDFGSGDEALGVPRQEAFGAGVVDGLRESRGRAGHGRNEGQRHDGTGGGSMGGACRNGVPHGGLQKQPGIRGRQAGGSWIPPLR